MNVIIISQTKQEFNGDVYYLCGKYFQRKGVRLHRVVWGFHNGAIPEGHHVHHKDGDRANNQIENLGLLIGETHIKNHMNDDVVKAKSRKNIAKAIRKAPEWHKSEKGREWHSKQALKVWDKRKSNEYMCTNCGESFATRHIYHEGSNRFCGNNCKSKYRRMIGADDINKACSICGDIFMANKYTGRKLCNGCSDKSNTKAARKARCLQSGSKRCS